MLHRCSLRILKIKYFSIIILIMEICKAPTLRLKALNERSITHIMYIEMEMLSAIKNVCKKEGEKKEKKKKANT